MMGFGRWKKKERQTDELPEQEHQRELQTPDIPDPQEVAAMAAQIQEESGNGALVGSKSELFDTINRTQVPAQISKSFWHFDSNSLSSSFLDDDDKFEFENLFWFITEMDLKQKPVKEITPDIYQDRLQIYLHGKSRLKQSQGTKNGTRTNLIALFTKAFSVVEQRNGESYQKPKRFGW